MNEGLGELRVSQTLFYVIEETKCIFRAVCCIKYSCDHCVTGDTYNNTRIYKKFNG